MKATEKKMKLQEDVLIPPVLDILGDQAQVTDSIDLEALDSLGDQAQVTDSIDLEAQHVLCIDQEVEVQEFAIVSLLDSDLDPVHHIE